ncbi:hypothetical protein [Marinilabilia salmonicolor]|uniref:Uncharacterized protein n=1 Tax=Marinilabilia salmonicolor TaxID=989 RepID=A0A368UNC1_9BACT|nr:hypothetical protein [Marinilabilia salmonicolor]RCW29685.1 hypothetical protein DFO77_12642 [Marinilabilia salmonicolor]
MNSLQKYKPLAKKSIAKPYIKRESFQIHQQILDNFIFHSNREIDEHNRNFPETRRQKLTEAHRSLLQQLYFEAVSQFELKLSLFENTELSPLAVTIGNPVRINTNNKDLAYRLSRSTPRAASTIYRRLERLKECGAITSKITHGVQANYDVYVNPELILLWDAEDPDYFPTSKFLKGGNSALYLKDKAKCKPSKLSVSFRKNKKIIPVNSQSVDNSNESGFATGNEMPDSKTDKKTLLETPEVVLPADPALSAGFPERAAVQNFDKPGGGRDYVNQSESNARKRSLLAAEYLYKYAVWLLWNADPNQDNQLLPEHLKTLYGGQLWNGRRIHRPEEKQTIEYLAANFFCHDTSPKALELQIENLRNRLVMASGYLRKKEYYLTGQWFVSPSMFFHKDNPNGLVGTFKWVTQKKEWQDRKAKQKSDRKKLLQCVEDYLQNPTIENYTRQLNSVRRSIPYMETEFIQRVSSCPMGATPAKEKSDERFLSMLDEIKQLRNTKQPFVIVNA